MAGQDPLTCACGADYGEHDESGERWQRDPYNPGGIKERICSGFRVASPARCPNTECRDGFVGGTDPHACGDC